MCNLLSDIEDKLPENNRHSRLPTFRKLNNRLKIWEMKDRYHCSILGTCLTLKELHHIARKAKIIGLEAMSDYDLHVSFVGVLDSKSFISSLVNKQLDKKYKRNIQQLSKAKTGNERNGLWREAVEVGDIAGAFWALVSHSETNESTLYNAYGKVHMLSHLSGASLRIDMQEFHRLKLHKHKIETQTKQNAATSREQSNKKDVEIKQLKAQLLILTNENKALKLVKQELKRIKGSSVVAMLQLELDSLKSNYEQAEIGVARADDAVKIWRSRAETEQEQRQNLEQKLVENNQEKQALEDNLTTVLMKKNNVDEIGDCSSCSNANKDLCGRCVLYVGGRSKQYTHFKELVEQQNGRFVHHDGGRENNRQHLASVVSQADVVLCPLDCVSHNAMNIVKRHCKSHTKPLIFIPHASLSAFSIGLNKVIN